MALYSEAELDVKAKATVLALDRNLEQYNIVQNMCDFYMKFCETPQAKKLSIRSRNITEGVKLRLLFEVLCYTTFLTHKIIPKYISTKKLLRRKTHFELTRYFNNQVAKHLLKFCQDQGMTKLQEVILISSPPEVKIKFGNPLHPIGRLRDYAKSHATKRGTELQRFGRNIGIALDPYHFKTLAALWKKQAANLAKLAEKAITEVFKPSVKLKV